MADVKRKARAIAYALWKAAPRVPVFAPVVAAVHTREQIAHLHTVDARYARRQEERRRRCGMSCGSGPKLAGVRGGRRRRPVSQEEPEMRIATLTAIGCLTLLGTTALAQTVTCDYDHTVNFKTFRTYAWTSGTELTDELNHARVVRAIDAVLAAKGLARVEPSANPDVLVAYHASFDKNLQITGSTYPWGPVGLSADRWGWASVQPVLVGTLLVDISDARTRAIVWRSLASSHISPTDKPESRDKKIAKATRMMFKNYPPKP
jgi:hypothetical protein